MTRQHTATRHRVVNNDRVRLPAGQGLVRQGVKHCHACDRDLPVAKFYEDRKTGRPISKCKDCRRRIARTYYQEVAKPRRAAA
jgi:hypothetical protein